MKKSLYILAVAAAAFAVSCNKYEISEAVDTNATVKTVSVTATLPSVSGEGLKTAFVAEDFLRVRFADASGAKVGRTQKLLNTSGSGANATFSSDKVAVPNGASTMYVYLDNSSASAINYASTPTVCDLASQSGTLADAVAKQVLMGSAPVSDNANISLAYKTGIIKVGASFPEGVTPVAGETSLRVSAQQFNNVVIDLDAAPASAMGDITATVSEVNGNTAYAYIAVWPKAAEYEDAGVYSVVRNTTYFNPLSKVSSPAGKTSEAKADVDILVYNLAFDSDAQVIEGVAGSVAKCDADWLTFSNGTINVAANNTGTFRTGVMEFSTGRSYNVSQGPCSPAMFKGDWIFTAKFFSNNKSYRNAGNKLSADMTFGEPYLGETLVDKDGSTYTNKLGVVGLYGEVIADAALAFDFDKKTVKFGLFLDARNAQKVSMSNISGYEYACLLPEMGTGAAAANWTSPWNFVQPDLDSTNDYTWLWFEVSPDFKTLSWVSTDPEQAQWMLGDLHTSANRIIGITCAVCNSDKVPKDSVYGTYNVIYQGNTNNDMKGAVTFVKK